jgi:hypothetical protein
MASRWQDLTDELNTLFQGDNLKNHTAKEFKKRHGRRGDGADPNTIPYKFGRFVEKFARRNSNDHLLTDEQKGKFLIDSGFNRWDPKSLDDLENVVKHCLCNENVGVPEPKEIAFEIETDYTATKASATVLNPSSIALSTTDEATLANFPNFRVKVKCPP